MPISEHGVDIPWRLSYGNEEVSTKREILRSVVGSGVHGIAIEGTDDHDEMGIYVPPLRYILGVGDYRDDFTARTRFEGERSNPGDTDLIIYSLSKYLRLAVKGNPTVLLPLYAPEHQILKTSYFGQELRENRSWFLSDDAVKRFLAYMKAQRDRMMGQGKQNRVPNRPELIERYGWDVKYGSHALRLAFQCWEIANNGHLTLPLDKEHQQMVLNVKTGEVPRETVAELIESYQVKIEKLLNAGKTAVPPRADFRRIEEWSVAVHMAMESTRSWDV